LAEQNNTTHLLLHKDLYCTFFSSFPVGPSYGSHSGEKSTFSGNKATNEGLSSYIYQEN